MGEKPNELDEQGAGGRPAAAADLDQDGPAAQKASGGGGKSQEQQRAMNPGVKDPTPAQIAIGDEGTVEDKSTRGMAGAGGGQPEPAEATNLNSSRSNIYRQAPAGGVSEPAEAANLNSSKSNVAREAPGSGPAQDHVYQHNQSDLD